MLTRLITLGDDGHVLLKSGDVGDLLGLLLRECRNARPDLVLLVLSSENKSIRSLWPLSQVVENASHPLF